jgi:hypothetical protein
VVLFLIQGLLLTRGLKGFSTEMRSDSSSNRISRAFMVEYYTSGSYCGLIT